MSHHRPAPGRAGAPAADPASIRPSAAVDPGAAARWRARLDTLTRWCLSDLPLAPGVADAAGAVRPTLGDLLRRALGRDGAGVVDLLDALDGLSTPAARALVGRVLGGELLLVVVTAGDGALVRADARACRGRAEARALVDAFLGGGVADWAEAHGVASAGAVRAPALGRGIDGAPAPDAPALPGGGAELTVVLPFLSLDDASAAAAQAALHTGYAGHLAAAPAILGGTLRPGAAFLDAPAPPEADDSTSDDDQDADRDEPADDSEAPDGRWDDSAADDADDDDADDDALDALDALTSPADHVDDDEDDAAAPDFATALDRARTRAAAPVERVSALIATDDGVAEHVADAAAWLAEASEQELRALARGGWSGDAALDVAHALAADDPEARDVVQQARRHEAELVVEIDAQAAAAWLARHRPDVARRLATLL